MSKRTGQKQDSGTYALALTVHESLRISIGAIGPVDFEPGCYVYIGSAMRAMSKRIARHHAREKKRHWHIDYLTLHPAVSVRAVWIKQSDIKEECDIAGKFAAKYAVINGFGASDCKCPGHLFYMGRYRKEPFQQAGLTCISNQISEA